MPTQPTPAPRTPPTKRSRDTAELEALAARFKEDWRTADRVMTWLVRHEGRSGELTALVRDGWSWSDVGQAMFLAGISYSTGRAIPAETLRAKAYRARLKAATEQRAIAERLASIARPPEPAVPVPGRPAVPTPGPGKTEPQPRAWEVEPEAPAVPMFRPVSLKGGRTLDAPQRKEPEMKTPPEGVKPSDDEIRARLFGSKSSS